MIYGQCSDRRQFSGSCGQGRNASFNSGSRTHIHDIFCTVHVNTNDILAVSRVNGHAACDEKLEAVQINVT